MTVLKTFDSKRNAVTLIEKNGQYIEKVFMDFDSFEKECAFHKRLSRMALAVPRILRIDEVKRTLHFEYIDGVTLLEHLEQLEKRENIQLSIQWLMTLLKSFKRMAEESGCYYLDVNLRNFIVKEDQLYLLDFEAVEDGEEVPIEKTLAYYLLYDPIKTPFKLKVIHGCIEELNDDSLKRGIWQWAEKIEKRRNQV